MLRTCVVVLAQATFAANDSIVSQARALNRDVLQCTTRSDPWSGSGSKRSTSRFKKKCDLYCVKRPRGGTGHRGL